MRYAPQSKGVSIPVTSSVSGPVVNQQLGSVTGGVQNNSASSGLVSGGYANATVLNPKSTIVPGVEKPSNINPNFVRTAKTTPANLFRVLKNHQISIRILSEQLKLLRQISH